VGIHSSYINDIVLLKSKEKQRDKVIYNQHKVGKTVNELSEMYRLSPRYIQFTLKNQRLLKELN
jgi:Mor family transcriptional regulator